MATVSSKRIKCPSETFWFQRGNVGCSDLRTRHLFTEKGREAVSEDGNGQNTCIPKRTAQRTASFLLRLGSSDVLVQ